MIELPFKMNFELDFSESVPLKKVLDKMFELLINISPKPNVNVILSNIDNQLNAFLLKLSKNINLKIIIKNPNNNCLKVLARIFTLNIEITKKDYNFKYLTNYNYNLIINVNFKKDIYKFLKLINGQNTNKIIIKQNIKLTDSKSYLKQLEQLKKDEQINKKCFLEPYLEENEIKKLCTNERIRPFLTCAALWFSPIIDHEGKIKMPCFLSCCTLNDKNFFDIWNSEDINLIRENLIKAKQFNFCKYCNKFYQDNFLIVENSVLKYKNMEYKFENILNPIKSAPIVGIIKEKDFYVPIPLYSDKDINEAYKKYRLSMNIR